jgi:hypothetical protein
MSTTSDPRSAKAAAHIRRLAPRLAELVREDAEAIANHEAATLLKFLRPGRAEEAAIAHQTFARLIIEGLAEHGGVQDEYATVINALGEYLELEGRACSEGRWVTEAEAFPEVGLRLASAG